MAMPPPNTAYEMNSVTKRFFGREDILHLVQAIQKEDPSALFARNTNDHALMVLAANFSQRWAVSNRAEMLRAIEELKDAIRDVPKSSYIKYWQDKITTRDAYGPSVEQHLRPSAITTAIPVVDEWAAVFKREYCAFCTEVISQEGNDGPVEFNGEVHHESCRDQRKRRAAAAGQEIAAQRVTPPLRTPPPQPELPADVGPWAADDALYQVCG
jgi:hypothetical protein